MSIGVEVGECGTTGSHSETSAPLLLSSSSSVMSCSIGRDAKRANARDERIGQAAATHADPAKRARAQGLCRMRRGTWAARSCERSCHEEYARVVCGMDAHCGAGCVLDVLIIAALCTRSRMPLHRGVIRPTTPRHVADAARAQQLSAPYLTHCGSSCSACYHWSARLAGPTSCAFVRAKIARRGLARCNCSCHNGTWNAIVTCAMSAYHCHLFAVQHGALHPCIDAVRHLHVHLPFLVCIARRRSCLALIIIVAAV